MIKIFQAIFIVFMSVALIALITVMLFCGCHRDLDRGPYPQYPNNVGVVKWL